MSPGDDPEFEPDALPPPEGLSPTAAAEQNVFAAAGAPPNSFFLRFGKGGRMGHLAWQSDTSTAVLALIVLGVLSGVVLLIIILSLFSSHENNSWLGTILQILGNAISGVAGAIVGASAAGSSQRKP